MNDIKAFDRSEVKQSLKEFLLRHFVKKEVRENERQDIITDVTLVDLQDNHTIYGHNESTPHFAASINKLPVTMLVLEELRRGTVSLDSEFTWVASDVRAGNGAFDQTGAPLTANVRELLHDLLNRSGNTAVRILVNGVLGGADAVNNRLSMIAEIPHTRLIPLDSNRFYLGDTTSKEALFVLRKVLQGHDPFQQYVKELMQTNIFVNDGVRSQLAGNDFIVLVNKTGLLYDPEGNNVHDVGIIYNTNTSKSYGYSMLTTSPTDDVTPRADESIKNVGKYVLRFAGDKPTDQTTQRLFSTPTVPETKILY